MHCERTCYVYGPNAQAIDCSSISAPKTAGGVSAVAIASASRGRTVAMVQSVHLPGANASRLAGSVTRMSVDPAVRSEL
jgi:hypothetical protein